MTEHDAFETRLRAALDRYVANDPTEFDALEFARTVATAEPRRRGHVAAFAARLDALPKGRRRWWSALVPGPSWSPALRLAWLVAMVALLLAATVSAIYVGSEMLRRADELAVVPPAVTPAPSESSEPMAPPWAWATEQVGEPIVSDTVLGTITWRVYRGVFGDEYATLYDPWDGSRATVLRRVGLPADVGTPYGPVGTSKIDANELGWLGPDGTVERTALPAGDVSLAPVGDGLIAYGTPQGYGHDQAWPISWDGSRWIVGDELDVPPFLLGGAYSQVAAGPSGVLIVDIDVAVARDGQHFVRVPKPPGEGDQIGPVFATADGFIALVSPGRPHLTSDPPFEPVPWFSADGLAWEPMTSSSPFGEKSWIRNVAERNGRYVAVGNTGSVDGNTGGVNGAWAVWLSDDGRTWERLLDLELGQDQVCTEVVEQASEALEWDSDCPIAVMAGDAGWVISTGKHPSLWASADGRAWERLTPPPAIAMEEVWGFPPGFAFGGDTIVVDGSDGLASAVGIIEP